jgi:hypothetical protein
MTWAKQPISASIYILHLFNTSVYMSTFERLLAVDMLLPWRIEVQHAAHRACSTKAPKPQPTQRDTLFDTFHYPLSCNSRRTRQSSAVDYPTVAQRAC